MNKQTKQLIERAYEHLDCLNNILMTPHRDRLHRMVAAEERQHRRGSGGYTVSVALTAKFFVVHDLARFAKDERKLPTLGEALGLRESYVYAAMLYANYKAEIDKALGTDVQALADLDYVKECCE